MKQAKFATLFAPQPPANEPIRLVPSVIFRPTILSGAYVIELEWLEDERGFFARTWCRREFERNGLNGDLVQCSISHNRKIGTLRGMHYQRRPHEETKLIRCTRGAVFDAIIDLREDSPTFKEWTSVRLTADEGNMLYVPEGFAHGFQTLTDDTELFYQMSQSYASQSAACVRWNDPAFGIAWPLAVSMISHKDNTCPDYRP